MNKTSTEHTQKGHGRTRLLSSWYPTQVRAVHHNIQSCPYKLERLQLFQHVLLCLSLKFQLTISAAVSCTRLRLHAVAMHCITLTSTRPQRAPCSSHRCSPLVQQQAPADAPLPWHHCCLSTHLTTQRHTGRCLHQLCTETLPRCSPDHNSNGACSSPACGGGTPLSLPALRPCSTPDQSSMLNPAGTVLKPCSLFSRTNQIHTTA